MTATPISSSRIPHVKVLYNRRGVSDYVLYDEAGIEARTGVTPARYPQYAALRGDPSDNLPGVPGVGEKTAAKLINTYGDLDGIYAHLDELSPKLRQSLADAEPVVRANAAATPLTRDVPVEVDPADAALGGWDVEELRRLFDFLEFRTLWDRFIEATGNGERGGAAEAPAGVGPGRRRGGAAGRRRGDRALHPLASGAAALAVAGAWEGREGRSPLRGLAFAPAAARGRAGRGGRGSATAFSPTPTCGPPWEPCSATTGSTSRPTTPRP